MRLESDKIEWAIFEMITTQATTSFIVQQVQRQIGS